MTDVQVRAKIAHDSYLPGETYLVSPERAQALRNADLVYPHVVEIRIPVQKESRRGTRKARSGAADTNDQGSVQGEAGEGLAPGGEPGEGADAG